MNKAPAATSSALSATRWRRPPIYAATRLRCAVAMLVFALAVLLAALPSLASDSGCDRANADQPCQIEMFLALK